MAVNVLDLKELWNCLCMNYAGNFKVKWQNHIFSLDLGGYYSCKMHLNTINCLVNFTKQTFQSSCWQYSQIKDLHLSFFSRLNIQCLAWISSFSEEIIGKITQLDVPLIHFFVVISTTWVAAIFHCYSPNRMERNTNETVRRFEIAAI